jgi:ADP-ribose pyrophosphatase YjhB (NUDIX family)
MATERKFCRFSRTKDASGLVTGEIPEGGFCLSTFLLISKKSSRPNVLLGKINPEANWEHIGALDKRRVELFKEGWMLPSSHLMLYESPQEASRRILREQVGLRDIQLAGPIVISEVYLNPRHTKAENHWDIEFIFTSTYDQEISNLPPVWRELRFVELDSLRKEDIARSHGDIIENAGLYKW